VEFLRNRPQHPCQEFSADGSGLPTSPHGLAPGLPSFLTQDVLAEPPVSRTGHARRALALRAYPSMICRQRREHEKEMVLRTGLNPSSLIVPIVVGVGKHVCVAATGDSARVSLVGGPGGGQGAS
jgi:hypothetical protein